MPLAFKIGDRVRLVTDGGWCGGTPAPVIGSVIGTRPNQRAIEPFCVEWDNWNRGHSGNKGDRSRNCWWCAERMLAHQQLTLPFVEET